MDKNLFRGKKIDGGEWIRGYYAENSHGSSSIQPKGRCLSCMVNPETVGQFTGLTDCLNNAMYEGDLVRAFDDKKCVFDKFFIGVVTFIGGAFGVEWHFTDFQTFMPFRDIGNKIKVVGNVFDNPEMLKCEAPLNNYIDRICLMCSKKCNEYLANGVDLYKHKVRILRDENRELKKILKVAINDLDYAMNVGKCAVCSNSCCEANSICKWKYKEEAEKLLEGDNK